MLVLTRKVDQRIQIGDGVVITILQVNGNKVRIGIEAPREVRILRGELDADDRAAEHSLENPHSESRGASERMLTFAPSAAPLVRSTPRLAAGSLRRFLLPRR